MVVPCHRGLPLGLFELAKKCAALVGHAAQPGLQGGPGLQVVLNLRREGADGGLLLGEGSLHGSILLSGFCGGCHQELHLLLAAPHLSQLGGELLAPPVGHACLSLQRGELGPEPDALLGGDRNRLLQGPLLPEPQSLSGGQVAPRAERALYQQLHPRRDQHGQHAARGVSLPREQGPRALRPQAAVSGGRLLRLGKRPGACRPARGRLKLGRCGLQPALKLGHRNAADRNAGR
mmetsp:Transcript_59811/g.187784  ORF Transcript_59811/g.187784 Transcript_59811/m.187784 type:complete len:234 (+) Transcript_59811:211-912(+)